MARPLDWMQLVYDAVHLAITLLLFLLFLWALAALAGKNLRDLSRFIRIAFRAEFTELPGWLDLVLFFVLLVFVYGPSIAEQALVGLRIAHLSTDPNLASSDIKAVVSTSALVFSLLYVGVVQIGKERQKTPRDKGDHSGA